VITARVAHADPARALTVNSLPAAFQATVARVPDRVALRTLGGEAEVTWARYGLEVARYAAALAGAGIGRGDTLALMTVNSPEFHYLDTAALHLGAIPISIYNTLPAADIAWILENAGVRMVIAEPPFVPVLLDVQALGRGLETVVSISGDAAGTTPLSDLRGAAPADFDLIERDTDGGPAVRGDRDGSARRRRPAGRRAGSRRPRRRVHRGPAAGAEPDPCEAGPRRGGGGPHRLSPGPPGAGAVLPGPRPVAAGADRGPLRQLRPLTRPRS
jgi:AMP-binding enzyme